MLLPPQRSTLFPYTTLFRSFVPGDHYNKVLFANPGGANNWISIKLTGLKNNRAAIGAKIKLTLSDARGQKSLRDRKSTRLNSSHLGISYAVFCLKKKTKTTL